MAGAALGAMAGAALGAVGGLGFKDGGNREGMKDSGPRIEAGAETGA